MTRCFFAFAPTMFRPVCLPFHTPSSFPPPSSRRYAELFTRARCLAMPRHYCRHFLTGTAPRTLSIAHRPPAMFEIAFTVDDTAARVHSL